MYPSSVNVQVLWRMCVVNVSFLSQRLGTVENVCILRQRLGTLENVCSSAPLLQNVFSCFRMCSIFGDRVQQRPTPRLLCRTPPPLTARHTLYSDYLLFRLFTTIVLFRLFTTIVLFRLFTTIVLFRLFTTIQTIYR